MGLGDKRPKPLRRRLRRRQPQRRRRRRGERPSDWPRRLALGKKGGRESWGLGFAVVLPVRGKIDSRPWERERIWSSGSGAQHYVRFGASFRVQRFSGRG